MAKFEDDSIVVTNFYKAMKVHSKDIQVFVLDPNSSRSRFASGKKEPKNYWPTLTTFFSFFSVGQWFQVKAKMDSTFFGHNFSPDDRHTQHDQQCCHQRTPFKFHWCSTCQINHTSSCPRSSYNMARTCLSANGQAERLVEIILCSHQCWNFRYSCGPFMLL